MNDLFKQLSEEFDNKDKLIADLKSKNMSLIMAQAETPACPYMCNPLKVQVASTYGTIGSLDDLSWADIAEIGAKGAASRVFALGSTKKFELTDGREMEIRIIGFNHDRDENGNILPITFEVTKCFYDDHCMNDNCSNKGGWAKSDMNEWLNSTVFALLPPDLRKVIKICNKTTSKGNASDTLETSSDRLWLLSEQEIFGRKIYSTGEEGHWYDYYRQENVDYGLEDHDGNRRWRWERSPYGSNATYFCSVYSDGGASFSNAYYAIGVAFGFCV